MQKDASTVPADPHGKRHHVVETLNSIDKGTSILVDHHVRSDFPAETALQALAQTFASHGSLLRFPWTATRVGLVPHKAATFLLPLCVFVTAWESPYSSAIRITPNNMGWWKDIIARSIRSASHRLVPQRWRKFAR
jgi:hypothetical protein